MDTLNLNDISAGSIEEARDAAVARARSLVEDPVVLSWRDGRTGRIAPDIPGAATIDRWREYGESTGGQIEISVAGDFHFVVGDAGALDEPHAHFANLTGGDGSRYFCVREACTEGDLRRLEPGYGGGIGGGVG